MFNGTNPQPLVLMWIKTPMGTCQKHNTQESQAASPFQAGDHKAESNRQDRITKTKH